MECNKVGCNWNNNCTCNHELGDKGLLGFTDIREEDCIVDNCKAFIVKDTRWKRLADLEIGTRLIILSGNYEAEIISLAEGFRGKGVMIPGAFEDTEFKVKEHDYRMVKLL